MGSTNAKITTPANNRVSYEAVVSESDYREHNKTHLIFAEAEDATNNVSFKSKKEIPVGTRLRINVTQIKGEQK